jgi:two-component system, NarL family, invasion response regulator UvrY
MRILIAEDDDTLRLLLQLQLEDVDDIEVVASAATAEDALRLSDEHRPEAAVVDVRMPGVEGAELLTALRARRPEMGVVAYSSSAGAVVGRQLADLGIPLVLKGELPRLVDALRASAAEARPR